MTHGPMPPTISLRAASVSRAPVPRQLEDSFAGRWNSRRAMWPAAATLVHAIGRALRAAGWWEPGSGQVVDGGQVIGFDLHPIAPCRSFAAALVDPASARASDFLFALPSSAAALAGVAFGLPRYQATVACHDLSGFAAVGHACDLLVTGRVERMVAAALTASEDDSFGMAVAWCLESATSSIATAGMRIEAWGTGVESPTPGVESPPAAEAAAHAELPATALDDVAPRFRPFSGPALLGATRQFARAEPGTSVLVTQPAMREDAAPARVSILACAQPFHFEENPSW